MDKEREAGSSALERALTVLEALQSETEPVGVNELAKKCGMSAATVYRILRTLKARNYGGWVTVELVTKYIDRPSEAAKEAIEYLRMLEKGI